MVGVWKLWSEEIIFGGFIKAKVTVHVETRLELFGDQHRNGLGSETRRVNVCAWWCGYFDRHRVHVVVFSEKKFEFEVAREGLREALLGRLYNSQSSWTKRYPKIRV
jgi:hypothetical protein